MQSTLNQCDYTMHGTASCSLYNTMDRGLEESRPTLERKLIMLVLSRKSTEIIHIGEDIVIKVIETKRNGVKIGIEAPSHVRVLRGELDAVHKITSLAQLLHMRHENAAATAEPEALSLKTA